MIHFNMRAKSALLAFAIATATSNSFCSQSSALPISSQITSFIMDNKTAILLSTIVGLWVTGEIFLNTDRRVTYNYDNCIDDFKELFSAYNVFDAKSRAIIKHFIKKYFIGAKVRLDTMTKRTKEADGSVVTVECKKLTQKPSGFIGLLDAYVFSQAKPITEFMTPAVTLYILITDPRLAAVREYNKYCDNKPEAKATVAAVNVK
jgi:hypothetical protein